MDVEYKNKELCQCAEKPGYAQRKLGQEQAKAFLRRINALIDAESLRIYVMCLAISMNCTMTAKPSGPLT